MVVAPTVAAVGLAYFSYGFPQAGNCVEIGIPQVLLVLIFTLVNHLPPLGWSTLSLTCCIPFSPEAVYPSICCREEGLCS